MDNLTLCTIIIKPIGKENETKQKVSLQVMFKVPIEAGMMCIIDGEMLFLLMKNTWIGDLGASNHITNNDTGL